MDGKSQRGILNPNNHKKLNNFGFADKQPQSCENKKGGAVSQRYTSESEGYKNNLGPIV